MFSRENKLNFIHEHRTPRALIIGLERKPTFSFGFYIGGKNLSQ